MGVSIGLTQIMKDHERVREVLGEADCACYWAKEHGTNRVLQYLPNDMELAARRGEVNWVARVNEAFEKHRFELYYQKYKALNVHSVQEHLEVLLRMRDDDGSLILPGAFLPAAERYNLTPEIDKWVISNVFERFNEIMVKFKAKELTCAINLSGSSINTPDFFEFVRDKAEKHNLPHGSICFELTESVAVSSLQAAAVFIDNCKRIGIKFALDDFGIGTSSFAYLKHLPVDYLKIDGSFVKDIENDRVDRAMVESINRIGHILGKLTVAEFAENEAIISSLQGIGLDFAQGFGVAEPKPLFPDSQLPLVVSPTITLEESVPAHDLEFHK